MPRHTSNGKISTSTGLERRRRSPLACYENRASRDTGRPDGTSRVRCTTGCASAERRYPSPAGRPNPRHARLRLADNVAATPGRRLRATAVLWRSRIGVDAPEIAARCRDRLRQRAWSYRSLLPSRRPAHVCRTPGISCEAVPASMPLTGAGIRRHLRPSAACGARVGAAESFVSFIPLFDGAALPRRLVPGIGCTLNLHCADSLVLCRTTPHESDALQREPQSTRGDIDA